ncbi:MAG: hypothetical protein IKR23_08735 [Lachnospiraceae bacterium]|nr:hypothetical protein [Lachnospiraceae bacterium]
MKKIKINKICSLALIVCVLMQGMCYPLPAGAADPERTGETISRTLYHEHGSVCYEEVYHPCGGEVVSSRDDQNNQYNVCTKCGFTWKGMPAEIHFGENVSELTCSVRSIGTFFIRSTTSGDAPVLIAGLSDISDVIDDFDIRWNVAGNDTGWDEAGDDLNLDTAAASAYGVNEILAVRSGTYSAVLNYHDKILDEWFQESLSYTVTEEKYEEEPEEGPEEEPGEEEPGEEQEEKPEEEPGEEQEEKPEEEPGEEQEEKPEEEPGEEREEKPEEELGEEQEEKPEEEPGEEQEEKPEEEPGEEQEGESEEEPAEGPGEKVKKKENKPGDGGGPVPEVEEERPSDEEQEDETPAGDEEGSGSGDEGGDGAVSENAASGNGSISGNSVSGNSASENAAGGNRASGGNGSGRKKTVNKNAGQEEARVTEEMTGDNAWQSGAEEPVEQSPDQPLIPEEEPEQETAGFETQETAPEPTGNTGAGVKGGTEPEATVPALKKVAKAGAMTVGGIGSVLAIYAGMVYLLAMAEVDTIRPDGSRKRLCKLSIHSEKGKAFMIRLNSRLQERCETDRLCLKLPLLFAMRYKDHTILVQSRGRLQEKRIGREIFVSI